MHGKGRAHHALRDEYSHGDMNPVIYVTHYDALAFCRWMTPIEATLAMDGTKTVAVFDLPHEIEWEYACRAGSTTIWHFDGDESQLGEFAWYSANSGATHPVDERNPKTQRLLKQPNRWGLFHMYGNVWEWCSNWYADDPNESVRADYIGTVRVLRGGSWLDAPWNVRSADRLRNHPSYSDADVGFRVARALRENL